MLVNIYPLLNLLQFFLVPICFILAWGFILALGGTLWSAARATAEQAQIMHQIPCPGCQFFTNNYRLKCTVNPSLANTEEAIGCLHYCQRSTFS